MSRSIRAIAPGDDAAIAAVIRAVMPEFGAGGPGFAIHDPEVDGMYAAYAPAKHAYFVVEDDASGGVEIVGGAGIAPLAAGDPDVCELRKMYILPRGRGAGSGRRLLARCLETGRALGFRRCYLETLNGMSAAMHLYEEVGFTRLDRPMGATGHFGCDRWYLLAL